MDEVLPGIYDWVAVHPKLGEPVHCHFVASAGAVIDPLLADDGLDPFREQAVTRVVLSNRHHDRDASRFVEAFGCDVMCNQRGVHEFEGRELDVTPFDFGDEPAPGIRAHQILPEWPDETGLLVEDAGLLIVADSLVSRNGDLDFVEDAWLGDHAEEEKAHLRRGVATLLELDFDHLMFAHAPPLIGGAKAALREFVGG